MLKKVGLVTIGAAATLAAVAPIASATDNGHDGHDGHDRGHHAGGGKACLFNGGNGGAESVISGDSLANAVAQAPVAGNNIANLANCSDFLNNNLNDNLSGNNIALL